MTYQKRRTKVLLAKKNREFVKARMQTHFKFLKNEIHNVYQDIYDEVEEKNARLVHPVLDELSAFNFNMEELIEGLDKTFELFIVGMGNYGKSTLINALLEQEVADIDVRPKTWKVDVYDTTLSPNTCVIVYKNGETEYKSFDETRVFIEEEENKTKQSRKKVKSELKKVLQELKTKEEVKETEDYLRKEFLYQSSVVEVRWPIKTSYLSKKFMVVDTPGLVQENLSGDTIVSVQKYYHKADGVIWIFDATKLASKKSKDMVEELEKSLNKIGGKTDNIVAVLNRIDLVRNNGGEEAEQKVIKEANRVLGKYFDQFICISAKQGMAGILDSNGPLKRESGIETLVESIDKNFYENAQKIQLQSREVGFKQIKHQLMDDSSLIKKYLNRLRAEQREYGKRKDKIDDHFKTLKTDFQQELKHITSSFIESAEVRIDAKADVLFDLETDKERETYIKDYLFCLTELEPELEKFHKYWGSELENRMKQLIAEVVFTEYKHIDPNEINKMFEEISGLSKKNISYRVNTSQLNTDDLSLASGAGFAAIGGLIFGPLGLLLAGVTGFLGLNKGIAKFFKSGGLKRDLVEAINKHVGEIEKKLLMDLNDRREKAESNVNKELNQTFINLHGSYESSKAVEHSLDQLFEVFTKPMDYPDLITLIMKDKKTISMR
ncbi:dynamin family protein [Halobacillus trueperi]|uniref:Dynamin N-terminal domain-containing protein n=1 Tax=Halobacillus trueperi TaxID=156205 RepID=A0A3E0JBP0_9BACI|nr:dynamin family protein [Halobacillus trueperi]REJ10346.1 hypothetical protein DYE48_06505 [Halobacillus trueperi]